MGTSWRKRAAATCASADGESHRREDFQETTRMAAQVAAKLPAGAPAATLGRPAAAGSGRVPPQER
jgi:hypothetical protein